jgi:hypothetical protein
LDPGGCFLRLSFQRPDGLTPGNHLRQTQARVLEPDPQCFIRKNPAKPVEFDRSQEFRWSPDYGNGVTAGVAIAAHQRHILTDSLGDHDSVERVTMVIGQRHHA